MFMTTEVVHALLF